MDRKISTETRTELVRVLGCRYRDSVKQEKARIRTLQCRVKEWRQVMARKLVYACMKENSEVTEVEAIA